MDYHGLFINYHGLPWTTMDYHGPCMTYHGLLLTVQKLPWATLDCTWATMADFLATTEHQGTTTRRPCTVLRPFMTVRGTQWPVRDMIMHPLRTRHGQSMDAQCYSVEPPLMHHSESLHGDTIAAPGYTVDLPWRNHGQL